MREAFSLKYDVTADRHFHIVLLSSSYAYVHMLEPVPPRTIWATAFCELRKSLKINMNDDSTVATLRLRDVLRDLFTTHRAHGLMPVNTGESDRRPMLLPVMFEGFSVKHILITHFCVANARLRPEISSQSEQLLRIIACARISETNMQLRKALQQNHFTEDFNSALSMKGFAIEDGTRVLAEMLVTADKKGVEAHR
eukprot:4260999-Pleurochrysis_carterae.AAC.1